MTGTEILVSVRDLGKRFKLYESPRDRLLEWVTVGRAVRHTEFWALRDVSVEVRRGECLGVIGVNGAGKSTLLKILSRALYPTQGSFQINGRLVSLLELGTGFHPDLTGRQNVFQGAQLLGFPEAYVRERLGDILEFAQIGDFIDQPVRQYSSGMFVRLAFSLFANLDPDVYIVDEALSVGDIFFQQKCFKRFAELRRQGCTVLLVSHDMDAITHLCDRALLLNAGTMVALGDPVSVVHDYFALSGQAFKPAASLWPVSAEPLVSPPGSGPEVPPEVRRKLLHRLPAEVHASAGTRATEMIGFAVSDEEGREIWSVPSGGGLTFWYLIEARKACDDLNVGIHFYDRRGILVFAIGTANRGFELPRLAAGQRLVCAMKVTLQLQPGEYTLVPQTGGLTGGSPEPGLLHDRLEPLPPVAVTRRSVTGPSLFYGLVELPTEMTWTEDLEEWS